MFRTPLTRTMAVVAVLALLALPIAAQAAPGGMKGPAKPAITQVAKQAGTFNTLLAALDAAGLYGTLTGQGPFTVFAPTDEAFAKLPAGTVEGLLADPMRLKQILLYHVVAGEVPASTVVLTCGNTACTCSSPIGLASAWATVVIPELKPPPSQPCASVMPARLIV